MQPKTDFPVADLSSDQLKKVQALEEELRDQLNENIILIAYESDK